MFYHQGVLFFVLIVTFIQYGSTTLPIPIPIPILVHPKPTIPLKGLPPLKKEPPAINKCGANEKIVPFKKSCPGDSCSNLYALPSCAWFQPTYPGCVCIDGYLRDASGKCIPKDQCLSEKIEQPQNSQCTKNTPVNKNPLPKNNNPPNKNPPTNNKPPESNPPPYKNLPPSNNPPPNNNSPSQRNPPPNQYPSPKNNNPPNENLPPKPNPLTYENPPPNNNNPPKQNPPPNENPPSKINNPLNKNPPTNNKPPESNPPPYKNLPPSNNPPPNNNSPSQRNPPPNQYPSPKNNNPPNENPPPKPNPLTNGNPPPNNNNPPKQNPPPNENPPSKINNPPNKNPPSNNNPPENNPPPNKNASSNKNPPPKNNNNPPKQNPPPNENPPPKKKFPPNKNPPFNNNPPKKNPSPNNNPPPKKNLPPNKNPPPNNNNQPKQNPPPNENLPPNNNNSLPNKSPPPPATQCYGANEEYTPCLSGQCRPKTCDQLGKPIACPRSPRGCAGGCICKEGYVRDSTGKCIDAKKCPSCGDDPNAMTGCGNPCGNSCTDFYKNKSEIVCAAYCEVNGCDCRQGFVYDDGVKKCVKPNNCSDYGCSCNATYVSCNAQCPNDYCPTNDQAQPVCDPSNPCQGGCRCKTNYRLNSNNQCILAKECPPINCTRANEVYNSCTSDCLAEQCCDRNNPPATCNTLIENCQPKCVCKEGTWRNDDGICVPADQCPSNSDT